ncbi:right-handed parallel beta-helix repeat-containing protein [Dyadobacter sp. CY345]|uniref:T9SS type A sorting domain-containing protein n=1 Tax=Dyadobacter sp. CY345 TaxID=2909335 RepID=UPI001F35D4DA|nr:T9SS type A sorting domain-containing protein [Dyadobacter sp. CY345]MCF2446764.1 right-handed parallel beta-helix repeat-containing protein [Dyadobacter sp. CY345]
MTGFKKCAFLIALFITVNAFGRDIFVATDGNDNLNDGSTSQPYLTINKAASVAIAGDIVTIRSGTYMPATRITAANSGTSVAPIIYRAEVQGSVIIDGSMSASPTSGDRLGLFTILGADAATPKSWIVVDGLRIINSTWAGFYANRSSNIIFRNCSTFNTGSSGIIGAASSNITVLNNTVQLACQFPSAAQGTNECITMASVNGFEVAYNSVSDRMTDINNGGEGIDAKNECKNGSIHHNIVFDLVRLGIYIDAYQRNLSNVDVYANKVYDCSKGIVAAIEAGGTSTGVKIHDNIVYDNPNGGIQAAGYLVGGVMRDLSIYQNTVVRCGGMAGSTRFENFGIMIDADNASNSNFVVRNNIVANCPMQIKTRTQNYLTVDNNLLFGPNSSPSSGNNVFGNPGTNAILSDPLFEDAVNNNFRLMDGSPAIDKAEGTPLSTVDFYDFQRTGLPDLGAIEYVSGVLPVTLVSFTGRQEKSMEKEMITLHWSTVSEINVSEYVIEKGNNPMMFEAIGSVSANNTIQANSYKFIDWNLVKGLQYYRLKMIDLDNTFEYSKIIAVNVNAEKLDKVVVFPNPATNSIIVRHESSADANGLIQIISSGGNFISKCSVLQNTTETKVDVSSLAKGSYVIVFERSGVKTSRVFIK